ncbi:MAG: glycerol-3-phosphate acyltransferase [Eubacterium ramulus]
MVVFRIISALLGYLFGLFPTGVLYGNAHHVDIRSKGSGNTGTTNSLRVLGWKAGVIVFLGDCLKAVAAMGHYLVCGKRPLSGHGEIAGTVCGIWCGSGT